MDFRVRTRRDFLKAAGFCASGLAFSGCAGPDVPPPRVVAEAPPQSRPNILWVTCEDISPLLGCYGDPFAITPHLNRFAGDAVLYTNAYATAPVCSPVRSCLVTGVYATSLGTQHLRSEVPPPKEILPFPKLLRAAGYYCSNNYKEDYNFKDPTIWDDSSPAAHWRNRGAAQPFFSVFNLMATHQGQINGSDEAFFEKYRSKLKPEERHDPKILSLPPCYPDTPMVRKIWARYHDLITYMDKQVGEILDQLEVDAVAENTIVFFFSDHGMGLPRFKRTLYDSGLHVPLMVRLPARYQRMAAVAPSGRTDRLVSFVDFAPTVLRLAEVPVPTYMQGRPFLGLNPPPPQEYVFGASSRVDEAYEMSRCVRDKRYKYIRNFMPHLPYVQPSDYPDQAEIMQELRRVAAEGKLAGIEKLFWQPTKPLEELYDTQTDPHEVKNLAGSEANQQTLESLRNRLFDWMRETHDTGLLPEAEMHIRAAGSTPYDMARDPAKYRLPHILAAAELVGMGPRMLPALRDGLSDSDSAVRYWAAVGLDALGEEAAPAMEALGKALNDPSPNVRFTAAGLLCRLGSCSEALPILTAGLQDPRGPVVLYAARTLQGIGDKAAPAVRQMELAREQCKNVDGSYKNDNYAMFVDWALKYAMQNCQP